MTNNFKESNLYFIKDTTDPTRPLMGDLLIYCETMAAMLANGIADKAEADRLCGLLNNGEIEYEEGREFEVVALPTIEHEDAPAEEAVDVVDDEPEILPEAVYLIEDKKDRKRPLMGVNGRSVVGFTEALDYGFLNKREAVAYCAKLNRGEVMYEDSEYRVVRRALIVSAA